MFLTLPASKYSVTTVGRDIRIDILRGAALFMMFVDHSSGNLFSYGTLQTIQIADAAEIFFLLSGYSCMAAFGRMFDQGNMVGAGTHIARRCIRLYLAQLLLLLLADLIVRAAGYAGAVPLDNLHRLVGVSEARLGVASSELFQIASWRDFGAMLSLLGEPAFFDILRTYIVLMVFFPLMWIGLRRAPPLTFLVSAMVWAASHGDHGLRFIDQLLGAPWTFNPFGWQFIFLCGAGLRVLLEFRANLPRSRALISLSAGIVAASLLYKLCCLAGLRLHVPLDGKTNLSPIRLLNTFALLYLALCFTWSRRFLSLPITRALQVCGRHSLLVFCLSIWMSLCIDLVFVRLGQGAMVQVPITLGTASVLVIAASAADFRRRRTRAAATMA